MEMRRLSAEYIGASGPAGAARQSTHKAGYKAAADFFTARCGLLPIAGRHPYKVAMADYATLLRDHTTLKVRSIDRIFLQAYVPRVQSVGQVRIFLRWQRRRAHPLVGSVRQNWREVRKEIERFSKQNEIPVITTTSTYGIRNGASFWKTNAYAPLPIWLWLDGPVGQAADAQGWDPVPGARHRLSVLRRPHVPLHRAATSRGPVPT
jgi:hypothetical protein